MKEQHNQKKLSIYISLLIVVVCLMGVSFAIFKSSASQATQNDITSLNCFEVEYSDVTNALTLTNDYPIPDAEGLKRTPYTFKIKNKCDQLLNVQIGVETLTTTQIKPTLIKGVITKKGATPTSAKLLSSGTLGTALNGGTNYILLEDRIYNNEEKEYDLRLWFTESMTKAQGSGKSYKGKVTVISSPITDQPTQFLTAIMRDNTVTEPLTVPGKEVSGHTLDDVSVESLTVSSNVQSYYITYGTGWEADGAKFNLTGTSVTSDTYANSYSNLVGKYLPYSLGNSGSSTSGTKENTTGLTHIYYVVSATPTSYTYKNLGSNRNVSEAVLAPTQDDYGTSYYFRGAVTNNFVEYANMCWRIVRVTGDGSIKLVLYNYNGLTSTNNTPSSSTPCNMTGDYLAFARFEGTTSNSKFNSSDGDNAYVGFMYGTVGTSKYADTHANINSSEILINLNKWYTNVLSKQTGFNDNQLADTIWCNDKKTFSVYTSGTTYGTGLGYGTNKTGYGAFNRIFGGSPSYYASPSLICPNDNNGGKLSKFTVNDTEYGNGTLKNYAKIGLLTADEVIYAGSKADTSAHNKNYYLNNNSDSIWITLSPAYFNDSKSYIYCSYGNGIVQECLGASTHPFRPVISLVSSAKVTGGGTATNPYKVIME